MVKKEAIGKSKKTIRNKISISLGIILVLLLILATVYYYWQPAKPIIEPNSAVDGKASVEIKEFAFNPNEVRIKKQGIVTWTNEDNMPHIVISDLGNELNSSFLSRADSYVHQFNETGTYNYHCGIHRYMKGKVIVE